MTHSSNLPEIDIKGRILYQCVTAPINCTTTKVDFSPLKESVLIKHFVLKSSLICVPKVSNFYAVGRNMTVRVQI